MLVPSMSAGVELNFESNLSEIGLPTSPIMKDAHAIETKPVQYTQEQSEVLDTTFEASYYAEGKWRAWSTGEGNYRIQLSYR